MSIGRRVAGLLVAACAGLLWAAPVRAEAPPDETTVAPDATEAPPDTTGLTPVTTTIPAGCPEPTLAAAVFVGTLIASDDNTARFRVEEVRAGSLDAWQVGGLVDVDYHEDTRYLAAGEDYLIGVGADQDTRRLESKIREAAPLFGGNEVAGVDPDVECPRQEDPIRTLHVDGGTVESGVLTPLMDDKQGLARALLLPAAWAFLALVALATVKGLLSGGWRELVRVARREPRVRDEDIWRDAGYPDDDDL